MYNQRLIKILIFLMLGTSANAAGVTLRFTPGYGLVTVSGTKYTHRSLTIGVDQSGWQHVVWSQVRSTQLVRRNYREDAYESGFGFASWVPETSWWVGGGVYSVNESGNFVTVIPWGQASYALNPKYWLQGAIIGGSRDENGFEGGIGQADFYFLRLGQHSQFKIGGFTSIATGALPGGGGVVQYSTGGKQLRVTGLATIGDFPHWIERETLLKYESTVRTQAILRCITTLNWTPRLFTEATVEYNQCKSPYTVRAYRSKEIKSWFGNLGIGYRIDG